MTERASENIHKSPEKKTGTIFAQIVASFKKKALYVRSQSQSHLLLINMHFENLAFYITPFPAMLDCYSNYMYVLITSWFCPRVLYGLPCIGGYDGT